MMEVKEAQEKILNTVTPCVGKELVKLTNALHRSLAEPIVSAIAVPPADNSAMDGYALHMDTAQRIPHSIPISQHIPAGTAPNELIAGTAARIFTGAEIPSGANSVVIQENTTSNSDGSIAVTHEPTLGDNIRKRGQDIDVGCAVLTQGKTLKAQDISLIASLGIAEVTVNQRLNIAAISTGDELVEPGATLMPGQIYNSNQSLITNLAKEHGAELNYQRHIGDDYAQTVATLKQAAECSQLIISTGGVSVGQEDHVKAALAKIGELDFWKVNLKPGKPIAFGKIKNGNDTRYFLGLPGNPVSAFITFFLFGKPLLCALSNTHYCPPITIKAPAKFDIKKPRKRPEYLRARVDSNGVEIHPNQSSGVLSSITWSNALVFVGQGETVKKGDNVTVIIL